MKAHRLVSVCLTGLIAAGPVAGADSAARATPPGTSAPAARIQTLDGADVELSTAVAGKPTLLIFWATWCPSCREQMPRFKGAQERFGPQGLNVVAVDIGIRDTPATVKNYAKEHALPYRILFDARQDAVYAYRVAGTPTVLLLNKAGEIVSRDSSVDFDAIDALLSSRPIPKKSAPPGNPPRGSFSH